MVRRCECLLSLGSSTTYRKSWKRQRRQPSQPTTIPKESRGRKPWLMPSGISERAKDEKLPKDEAMEGFKKIAQSYYEDFDTRDYPKGVFDETCMDTVPLSLSLISKSKSFEDAIRLAISHGGDSDTIGAIVGSIAEARFGIPQAFKNKAMSYLPEGMKQIYKLFAEKSEIIQQ